MLRWNFLPHMWPGYKSNINHNHRVVTLDAEQLERWWLWALFSRLQLYKATWEPAPQFILQPQPTDSPPRASVKESFCSKMNWAASCLLSCLVQSVFHTKVNLITTVFYIACMQPKRPTTVRVKTTNLIVFAKNHLSQAYGGYITLLHFCTYDTSNSRWWQYCVHRCC